MQQDGLNVKHFFYLHSFGMAYDFIDCIGDDVDVVSDSEVSWAYPLLSVLVSEILPIANNIYCFLFSSEHQKTSENPLQ